MKFLALLILSITSLFAQAPNYFGLGFVSVDATKTPSSIGGGVMGGKRVNAFDATVPIYSTIEVTPGGSTTATVTAGVWARIWANDRMFIAVQGAAGASTFGTATGMAFETGGAFGYRPFINHPFAIVFKPSAIKVTVGDSTTPGKADITKQFKIGLLWAFN